MTFEATLNGKAKQKDGKAYFDNSEMKVSFEPTDMVIEVSNLFNGNKELSK